MLAINRVAFLPLFAAFAAVGAAGAADPPKPATTTEELFFDIPKSSWPAAGKDGLLERKATDEWMAKNLQGLQRQIEWKAKVADVDFGRDALTARVSLESKLQSTGYLLGWTPWEKTKSFGDELLVFVTPDEKYVGGARFIYEHITAAEGKALRELKGKEVKIRAPIRRATCSYVPIMDVEDGRSPNGKTKGKSELVVTLVIFPPALDDFKPAAAEWPKMTKSPKR